MKRTWMMVATAGALMALTACSKGSVSGTVTDGVSGKPVGELRVLAKAESPDLTCQVFETTTDASGNFAIEGLCANTTYTLSTGDDTRFLTGTLEADGGTPTTGVGLTSWTAPEGDGVYILDAEGNLSPQRTKTDVNKATLLDTDVQVKYLSMKFDDLPDVSPGAYLVLVGESTIQNQIIEPLVVNPEVLFAPDREDLKHWSLGDDPWPYIGVKLTPEGEHTAMTATVDESKLIDASQGERAVRYIPSDALPAGDYAMATAKNRRTYLFTFGEAAAPAEEAPAE